MTEKKNEILVRIITKSSTLSDRSMLPNNSHPAFPGGIPRWGSCRFIFDNASNYDWIVVYDDFNGDIALKCPAANSLLVTSEPSSVKTYERPYIKQFAYVLTGQEDWALKHPGKIHSQPALFWFYGTNQSYDETYRRIPDCKTEVISTVTSNKQQKHTLHQKRFKFIEELQEYMPELDRFGKGIRPVENKSEALDPYRYHIAIENHICDHWWTEKLSDAFLGLTLPLYYGAPNAADYFPKESFIPIDLNDFPKSLQIIKHAIQNNEYKKRLPAIHEARKRVLEKYNFYATVASIIEERHSYNQKPAIGQVLRCRHSIRRNPISAISTLIEKGTKKITFKYLRSYLQKSL